MKLPTVSGKWLFALMGLLLLGALGFVVAKSGPLAPIRVTVVKVEQGTVLEARRAYLIGPTVAGRVQILDGQKAGSEVVVYSERELVATSRANVVTALPGQTP